MNKRILATVGIILLSLPVIAQQEFEGWERLETEHFLFIFEDRERNYVNELLTFAEDAYDRITMLFDSFPTKIPCVVYGRDDSSNGYTFPADSIWLSISSPSDPLDYGPRTESWLKEVFIHELTHYVHSTMETGIFYVLSRIFGRNWQVPSFVFIPEWMIEGLGVYTETAFTQGGRGRNKFFEARFKALLIENQFFHFKQAGVYGSLPPLDRPYIAGYLFVSYLVDTYGEDVIRRISDTYLRFPFFGFRRAIKKVTGVRARQLYEEMHRELAEGYRADPPNDSGALVVSKNSPRRTSYASYFAPQATSAGLFAYREHIIEFPAIVRMNQGEEAVVHKVWLSDRFSYAVTGDGTAIYYTEFEWNSLVPVLAGLTSDLYYYQIGHERPQKITEQAHLFHPAVSPKADTIVAVQGSGPYKRLVVVDHKTGELHLLYSKAEANVYNPTFSPDGKTVAFVLNVRGVQDLYTIDLERALTQRLDTNETPLVDYNTDIAQPIHGPDDAGDYFPSFVDDNTVLFASDREGSLALYSSDLEGNAPRKVLEDPVGAFGGIVDDELLIYSSYTSTGYVIKEARLDALEPIQIESPQPVAYPEPQRSTGIEDLRSSPYFDIPRPQFWIPIPVITFTHTENEPVHPLRDFGLGVNMGGTSILGTSYWDLVAGYYPAHGHPTFSLWASTLVRRLRLSYNLWVDYYSLESEFIQDITQNVSMYVPLIERSHSDTGYGLFLDPYLYYSIVAEDSIPFNVADRIGGFSGTVEHSFSVSPGVHSYWFKDRWRFDFSLYGDFFDTPSVSAWSEFTAPSFVRLHNIVLFTSQQFTFAEDTQTPGIIRASIEYAMLFALLDQPLILQVHLHGLGAVIGVRGGADWGVAPAQFVVNNEVSLYIELIPVLSLMGGFPLPFDVGVDIQMDFSDLGARPAISPYFFTRFFVPFPGPFRARRVDGPQRNRPPPLRSRHHFARYGPGTVLPPH